MSRIKGLNDRYTLKRKPPQAAIKVWKGEKKTKTSAGKSLENRFRIEAPLKLKQAIKLVYNATESNGSLYVDRLNIIPAYEDEFKTFDSKMAAFSASRPILFCDRSTIHTRFIDTKDRRGNIYFQPIESSDPCPVAGTNHECPNRCGRTGDFYFYIHELVMQGYAEFARLQVHGVADNQNIATVLDEVKASIGAIKTSPFVSESTRTYIVYEMTRALSQYKYPIKQGGVRTDKRGIKDDWIINLSLHPIWLNKYQNYTSQQQLLSAGMRPSVKLIEQIHDPALIEPASTLLPASESDEPNRSPTRWVMDETKFQELSYLWQQHGWHKNAIAELLYSHFDISDRPGLMAITQAQFAELKRLSSDESIKSSLIV